MAIDALFGRANIVNVHKSKKHVRAPGRPFVLSQNCLVKA